MPTTATTTTFQGSGATGRESHRRQLSHIRATRFAITPLSAASTPLAATLPLPKPQQLPPPEPDREPDREVDQGDEEPYAPPVAQRDVPQAVDDGPGRRAVMSQPRRQVCEAQQAEHRQ